MTATSAADPPRQDVRIVVELTTLPLDPGAAHEQVQHRQAGGVGLFTGMVRDHHDGTTVAHLDYEAWEEQAEGVMRRVAEQVSAAHPGVRAIHVSHRLGHLEIGEVSVVCAASAPHRDEALRAVRALIDGVKGEVPIWKRETFTDGTVHWPGC